MYGILKISSLLLGTKIDLRKDKDEMEKLANLNKQPYKKSDGEKLCTRISAVRYMECSALTQENLKNVSHVSTSYTLNNRVCSIEVIRSYNNFNNSTHHQWWGFIHKSLFITQDETSTWQNRLLAFKIVGDFSASTTFRRQLLFLW